jgi:hypothetical protein
VPAFRQAESSVLAGSPLAVGFVDRCQARKPAL